MALKRALRLRKSSDFQRVRQQGRVVSSPLLVLAYSPNNALRIRIGFVVSKRISKLAVKRNYIKRLVSEAIRPFLPELLGNWDVVLSVRQQVVDVSLAALTQDIGMLLHRAQLRVASSKQSN